MNSSSSWIMPAGTSTVLYCAVNLPVLYLCKVAEPKHGQKRVIDRPVGFMQRQAAEAAYLRLDRLSSGVSGQ